MLASNVCTWAIKRGRLGDSEEETEKISKGRKWIFLLPMQRNLDLTLKVMSPHWRAFRVDCHIFLKYDMIKRNLHPVFFNLSSVPWTSHKLKNKPHFSFYCFDFSLSISDWVYITKPSRLYQPFPHFSHYGCWGFFTEWLIHRLWDWHTGRVLRSHLLTPPPDPPLRGKALTPQRGNNLPTCTQILRTWIGLAQFFFSIHQVSVLCSCPKKKSQSRTKLCCWSFVFQVFPLKSLPTVTLPPICSHFI